MVNGGTVGRRAWRRRVRYTLLHSSPAVPLPGAQRAAFSIGFVKVRKIDLEEQSRNNSFAQGTFMEAQNAVWNGLNSLFSSELWIRTRISGERNHKGSKNGGFGTYRFMLGENAQINSLAENSVHFRAITLKRRDTHLHPWHRR